MTSMLVPLVLGAAIMLLALAMDGAIPGVHLEKLANFPFKGMPSTNGAALALIIVLLLFFAYEVDPRWVHPH